MSINANAPLKLAANCSIAKPANIRSPYLTSPKRTIPGRRPSMAWPIPSILLAGIGFGKFSARQALNRLVPGATSTQQPETESTPGMSDAVKRVFFGKGSDSLTVEGQNDLLVYRARCCNPIRGEEIVGYVTRGKGVAVHARSCPNVQNLLYESDRRIAVEWARYEGR